ncbi:MAG TPA: MerR family transcriptional regulator [Ktedonobacteraceae bacterium]|nr:MerR family transcriptional regulator [Ktedonobacteraceae bacterium]
MRERLQIGEIARLVGVSTKTIRYYHQIDLLPEPERTNSGYRLYTARHLLQLQRIRHLRALGLPLERIREVLGTSSEQHESTLRVALYALVEEMTAQILELEERRAFLQQLLTRESLNITNEGAYLIYSPDIITQLAPHLAHLSTESLKWGQQIDAVLGTFNWPAEYRQGFQRSLQHIVDHAEQYRQLFALEARFAALAHLPADAPEVEQLAQEYIQSQELALFFQQLVQTGLGEHSPFSSVLGDLVSSMVAPAQQRFFELLYQKDSTRAAEHSSIAVTHHPEQEPPL